MTYEVPDDEFLRMVHYFYDTKGDPTRYSSWDEDRFARLRPAAHHAWRTLRMSKMICNKYMDDLRASNSDGSFDT